MLPHCDVGPVCCDTWFDLLDGLVVVAHAAVQACGDGDPCGTYQRFISVGEPTDPVSDYVGGWISDVTFNVPRTTTGSAKMANYARPRLTLNVKLSEGGWPMIEAPLASIPVAPSFDERHWAALHSYAHAQAMFHASYDHLSGTCSGLFAMGTLRPVGPSGGVVGWTFAVQVDV